MAKGENAIPAMPKSESRAHINWDAETVKLSGDVKALALGKKVRIILEGTVKGYGMHEYGCDLDMKVKTVLVDGVSESDGDDDGPSMADTMGKMGKKHTKPY